MSELTTADVLAMKDNDGGMMGGQWLWWFIIILFLFNGNMFGGGNAAPTSQVNSDFLYRDIANVDRDTLMQGCETRSAIAAANYDTLLGVKDIEYQQAQGFQQTQYQLAQCCCELKTTIHSEGEETRRMIQSQIIQELRDNLTVAQNTIQVNAQTANLISSLRPFPQPAYITASPYTSTLCNY